MNFVNDAYEKKKYMDLFYGRCNRCCRRNYNNFFWQKTDSDVYALSTNAKNINM